MKNVLMMMAATCLVFFSQAANAQEAQLSAQEQVAVAQEKAAQISFAHAQKMADRKARAGRPDLDVTSDGRVTSFGRVLEGEELYYALGRPDLAEAYSEAQRDVQVGKGLIVVGSAGLVISTIMMTAELGSFAASFATPAGAGRGAVPSGISFVAGIASVTALAGGFHLKNQTVDPLSPNEKIELLENQFGEGAVNSPKFQATMKF
ncbi:hypothetical protein FRD01_13435 [Microvenator marinus]|uniref:Uncharacterized protein n=1 Tax=Microvenator marinus TaxID=2600177 RepID=A0A5B8XSU7_9DELT|nr:hypothetical protein [Microvenator marinus]QED28217.1 hypothetical protein FRD01_13435 [Microvenator marinus]